MAKKRGNVFLLSSAEQLALYAINQRIINAPRPVFKLVDIPAWVLDRPELRWRMHDECTIDDRGSMIHIGTRSRIYITQHYGELEGMSPSCFEFVEYRAFPQGF